MKKIRLFFALVAFIIASACVPAAAQNLGDSPVPTTIYCHANDDGDYPGSRASMHLPGEITFDKNIMSLSRSAPTRQECHDLALAACVAESTHSDDCWANFDDSTGYRDYYMAHRQYAPPEVTE